MKSSEQMLIKEMVQGIYDVQKLRIASGQRILASTLSRLGLPPEIQELPNESKEEKSERLKKNKERDVIISEFLDRLDANSNKTIKEDIEDSDNKKIKKVKKKQTDFFQIILKDYKGIVDYVTQNKGSIDKAITNAGIGIISEQTEYEILKAYFKLVESEETLMKPLKRAVESHPLWINFLKDVKGCGILMAGVILSEFDIHKTTYVSGFWKYAGLDTVIVLDEDGNPTDEREGRSRKAEHLVDVEYVSRNGEIKTKKSITFNPFLKTKLVGVLASCFLRSGGYYSEVYYNYKNRLQNMPAHADKTKAHIDAMAKRYVIKYFLQDMFTAWAILEGRTPPLPYHVEKLGMAPHHTTCPYLIPLLEKHAPFLIV